MNNQIDSRTLELIRSRVEQIREESPWMESYEIEAIICNEFGLTDFDSASLAASAPVAVPASVVEQDPAAAVLNPYDIGSKPQPPQPQQQQPQQPITPRMQERILENYAEIQPDAIGKYGAYAVVSSAANRRDVATRALYDLAMAAENDKESAAIVEKARVAISEKIKRESNHLGVTLLLSLLIEVMISVLLVLVAVLVIGWGLDEVYEMVTKPQNMALLHAGLHLLAFGFPFIVYLYAHKLPLGEILPLHRLRKGELLPMVSIGLAMMLIKSSIENYVKYPGSIRGGSYSYDVITFGNTWVDAALNFFCMGVIPALIETLVFNGVILQVMRRRGGDEFALLFTALLYTVMTANFVEMPGAFAASLVLSYMVIFSGSLVPAVLTHLIERVLFFIITETGFIYSDSMFVQYLDSFVTIVAIGLGLLSFFKMVDRFPELFVTKKSDPCLNTAQKMRLAATRTPIIILILISIAFSATQLFELSSIVDTVGKFFNA